MDCHGKSESIISPQITSWIVFALNLIYAIINIFNNDNSLTIFIDPIIMVIIALFVTFGISNKNHSFYYIGLIMSLINSSLESLLLLLAIIGLRESKILTEEEKKKYYYVILVLKAIFAWVQSCILIGYNQKVKKLCDNSQINLAQTPIQKFGNEILV